MVLDSKQTFKPHIKEQLRIASAKASASKFIPKDVMVRLYKEYVLPHLEYCSPLLLCVGNAASSKIENISYCILRFILRNPKSAS